MELQQKSISPSAFTNQSGHEDIVDNQFNSAGSHRLETETAHSAKHDYDTDSTAGPEPYVLIRMWIEAKKPIPVIHIRDDETTPTFPVYIEDKTDSQTDNSRRYIVRSSTTFKELLEKHVCEAKHADCIDLHDYSIFYASKIVVPEEFRDTMGDRFISGNTKFRIHMRLPGGANDVADFPPKMWECLVQYSLKEYPECDEKKYVRGGRPYNQPCGWSSFRVNLEGKYGDLDWLEGKEPRKSKYQSAEGEWPISYHGTAIVNGSSIAREGYKLDKIKNGCQNFGNGFYSTPVLKVAMDYAVEARARSASSSGRKTAMGVTLLVVMNRVDPSDIEEIATDRGVYYRTTKESNIRPSKILYKTFSREAVNRIL